MRTLNRIKAGFLRLLYLLEINILRLLKWFKLYFWTILLACFSSILFVFLVLPFLMGIKFIDNSINYFLSNSRNIEFFLLFSSCCQIAFIIFGKKFWNFLKKYINSIRRGIIEPRIFIFLFSSLIFLSFSIKLFKSQYDPFLSFFGQLIILLVLNVIITICLLLIFDLIGWLAFNLNYLSKSPYEEHNNILTDAPITSQSEDLLDRKKFVSDLYEQITHLPYNESFVFGLYGGWGEGKTSVLNLRKQGFVIN